MSPSLDRVDLVDTSPRDWVTDFLVLGGYDGVDLANPWFTQDAIVRGDFVDDHECLSADHWQGVDIELYSSHSDRGSSFEAGQQPS